MALTLSRSIQPSLVPLLSQALVAFTIELDNAFEHRMPHRTTVGPASKGVWLVSVVMWLNCLRYLPGEGLSVRDLQSRACTSRLGLAGLLRWGYVSLEAGSLRSTVTLPSDAVLHLTVRGAHACDIWKSLPYEIEKRWAERFGSSLLAELKTALTHILAKSEDDLPAYLPIVGYGLFTEAMAPGVPASAAQKRSSADAVDVEENLLVLMSKTLLTITRRFEREWKLSLPCYANFLCHVDQDGVRARDLPRLSGVSKEAIKMISGVLEKQGLIALKAASDGGTAGVFYLTPLGAKAKEASEKRIASIEDELNARVGSQPFEDALRVLGIVIGPGVADKSSPFSAGLKPYADGWRAAVPWPATLPHCPTVLHRGGYPDGS